jgi:hypothetical protein
MIKDNPLTAQFSSQSEKQAGYRGVSEIDREFRG